VRVGVPRETAADERRVALVPDSVTRLAQTGIDVVVEEGAGVAASYPDDLYREAGAAVGSPWDADALAKVQKPSAAETERLSDGQVLIGFLQPLTDREGIERIGARGAIAFAMESIPRITRAQSMDALSSQASVGGYKAVLLAADRLPRFFPMLMTAAGTIRPATVLVLGVGVAGLQAIATARRLGAVVQAFDVRPEVADQVRSLGATWLEAGPEASGEGGYARELTEEERAEQQQALQEAIGKVDVVITTALVPGRPAPKLITADAANAMKPGGVIVDLAGEAGGNCELTKPGETYTTDRAVTIAAPLNLPSSMAEHASQLYARNVASLLELMTDKESGDLTLDFEDQIIAGACIARGGEIVHEGAKKAAEGA
jgi:NAD(P) transhydrogenase subunit alpha